MGGICDSLDGQAKWGIWPQDGEDQTLRVPPDLNLFNSKNGKNIFLVLLVITLYFDFSSNFFVIKIKQNSIKYVLKAKSVIIRN